MVKAKELHKSFAYAPRDDDSKLPIFSKFNPITAQKLVLL
jgi:hypothetical protein